LDESIEQKLRSLGLIKPEFDPSAIEADLQSRIELDCSLDPLIGSVDFLHLKAFDPMDPS
jgi:hypothetical protein